MPGIAMGDDGIKSTDTLNVGGFLAVYKAAVAGTAVNVIADGPGDVTAMLTVRFVIRDSAGTLAFGSNVGNLTPGTQEDMIVGISDSCALRINANGSVDIVRTTGTRTYDCSLVMQWI